jgi:hypothetical protein
MTIRRVVSFRDGQWYFTPHDSAFGMKDNLQQDLLWKFTVPPKDRQKALRYFHKFNLNEMLAANVIDMRE